MLVFEAVERDNSFQCTLSLPGDPAGNARMVACAEMLLLRLQMPAAPGELYGHEGFP